MDVSIPYISAAKYLEMGARCDISQGEEITVCGSSVCIRRLGIEKGFIFIGTSVDG